jgi:hypothetical protein
MVLILTGAYLAYRVLVQLLSDTGTDLSATLVSLAWLGVCVYSWVGPGLFQRMLQKELAQVRLGEEF